MANMKKITTTRDGLKNLLNRGNWAYILNNEDGSSQYGKEHPHDEKPLDKASLGKLISLEEADFVHLIAVTGFKTNDGAKSDLEDKRKWALNELKKSSIPAHRKSVLLEIIGSKLPGDFSKAIIESLKREVNKQSFLEEAVAAGKTDGISKESNDRYEKLFNNKTLDEFIEFPEKLAENQTVFDLETSKTLIEFLETSKTQVKDYYSKEFNLALAGGYSNERLSQMIDDHQNRIQLFNLFADYAVSSALERKVDSIIKDAKELQNQTTEMQEQIAKWKAEKSVLNARVRQLAVDMKSTKNAIYAAKHANQKRDLDRVESGMNRGIAATSDRNKKQEKHDEVSADFEDTKLWNEAAHEVIKQYEIDLRQELYTLMMENGTLVNTEEKKEFLENGKLPKQVLDFFKSPTSINKIKNKAFEQFHKDIKKKMEEIKNRTNESGAEEIQPGAAE